MCRLLEETGFCKFGQNCRFAHGEEQLRNPHDPMTHHSITTNQTASMAYMNAYMTQPPPKTKASILEKLKEATPAKSSTYASSSLSPTNSPDQ